MFHNTIDALTPSTTLSYRKAYPLQKFRKLLLKTIFAFSMAILSVIIMITAATHGDFYVSAFFIFEIIFFLLATYEYLDKILQDIWYSSQTVIVANTPVIGIMEPGRAVGRR